MCQIASINVKQAEKSLNVWAEGTDLKIAQQRFFLSQQH